MRRPIRQSEQDDAQDDTEIESGPGQPDASCILRAAFQSQQQIKLTAGQTPEIKPFAYPGDQPPEYKAQRLHLIDGIFEIDGFFDLGGLGGGQGGFDFFSASLGEKLKYLRADSLCQSSAR